VEAYRRYGAAAGFRFVNFRCVLLIGAEANGFTSAGDLRDVVSMLLAARDEEDHTLSRGQIRDNLLTPFVAGHETLANAMSWRIACRRTSRGIPFLSGALRYQERRSA
jgi:Cytochrome P450